MNDEYRVEKGVSGRIDPYLWERCDDIRRKDLGISWNNFISEAFKTYLEALESREIIKDE
jgi:hypothetical protein